VASAGVLHIADEKYIYLTTKGRKTGKSHTVELWYAVAEGRVYLSHEGRYTDWMKNILKGDRVEFRIGGIRFRGKAKIVKNGKAFELGKNTLYAKYYGEANQEVINDWFSESNVIEISSIETV